MQDGGVRNSIMWCRNGILRVHACHESSVSSRIWWSRMWWWNTRRKHRSLMAALWIMGTTRWRWSKNSDRGTTTWWSWTMRLRWIIRIRCRDWWRIWSSSKFKTEYAHEEVKVKMEKVYHSILKRLERDFGGKPHFPICKTIQDSYYEPILDE